MLKRPLLVAGSLLVIGATALAQEQQQPPARKNARPPAQQPGEVIVPKAQKIFPTDAQWTLVSINGKPPGRERPTVQIDGQYRARGFAGCNTFSATAYPLPTQRMAVGPIAATKKACDKDIMASEKQFLLAFRTSQMWDLKDGQLIIAGQGVEMRFTRSL